MLRVIDDSGYTVDDSENYVASDERDTTGHGTKILTTINTFAPRSRYKLYRLIAGDGEFRPSNFLRAMDDVRDDDIDVVNISAGKYHESCGGRCRLCAAVEGVVRAGSTVVAGAGNRKGSRKLGVFCPARSSDSIAVGMSETLCNATPPKRDELHRTPNTTKPPGAYWGTVDPDRPYYPSDAYCSHRGCSPFDSCRANRQVIYWDGNVEWNDYLPEVVAPGHFPIANRSAGEFALEPGTSYSTAIVTGCIATVMSERFPDLPTPQRIKRALESTSRDLDCGIVGMIDMEQLLEAVS